MDQLLPTLVLFALGAAGVVVAMGLYGRWMEPGRRVLRTMASRLGGLVDVATTAPLRGQGVGLRITPPGIVVVRRANDQGLVFAFEELSGVELIFDGEVRARAFRGEPRRPLDSTHPRVSHVCVRLVFDDIKHPDFELELRHPDDPGETASAEVEAARRLFAHLETVIRQTRATAQVHTEDRPDDDH